MPPVTRRLAARCRRCWRMRKRRGCLCSSQRPFPARDRLHHHHHEQRTPPMMAMSPPSPSCPYRSLPVVRNTWSARPPSFARHTADHTKPTICGQIALNHKCRVAMRQAEAGASIQSAATVGGSSFPSLPTSRTDNAAMVVRRDLTFAGNHEADDAMAANKPSEEMRRARNGASIWTIFAATATARAKAIGAMTIRRQSASTAFAARWCSMEVTGYAAVIGVRSDQVPRRTRRSPPRREPKRCAEQGRHSISSVW